MTDNQVDDKFPHIHGKDVAWQQSDGYRWQIFFYHGSSTFQLTRNNMLNIGPMVDHGQVAWASHYHFAPLEVNIFDGAASVQLTDDEVCDMFPHLSNGKMVWQRCDGGDSEIFFYNGTCITQLTDNRTDDRHPRIVNDIVAWEGFDGHDWEIFIHNNGKTTQLTHNQFPDRNPEISKEWIAWEGFDGHDWEIFLYDGESIRQVTRNGTDDTHSVISGNDLIWRAHGTYQTKILMDTFGRNTVIRETAAEIGHVRVARGLVVWEEFDGNDWEIFLHDGHMVHQLTCNQKNDRFPAISANGVVWEGSDGTDTEIYVIGIHHVPSDFPAIQEAIDVALKGDIISVDDGIYTGKNNKNLDFRGKALILCSKNGPEQCIIDCQGQGRGFIFQSGETGDTKVSGFTVSNGLADKGGAILCSNACPWIGNCIINNSTAETGGGIYAENSATALFNTIVSNNTAEHCGGGITISGQFSMVSLHNMTMADNIAKLGGGLCLSSGGMAAIGNTILWYNMPDEIQPPEAMVSVFHSDVQGGWPGQGNINSPPLFIDPNRDSYRIGRESPCIDAGHSGIQSLPPIDFEGERRPVDGNLDGTPDIDMGADEFSLFCQSDLDKDHDVDESDVFIFLGEYGRTDCGTDLICRGDFDGDGDVDVTDFALFAKEMGSNACTEK
ncbi:hypothetical protein [Desulfobacter latus]|uniref:Probable pectate lyase C n=1 Tax=Desulfobacter latus TaxID=2292 RepID=A0A850SQW0_9BACT|nr:hypothetical protein [Desulfobacter latus]NWH03824.1 hypothetical protein [Desulfobacter latus]